MSAKNINTTEAVAVKPFLKWAGGKTQLIDDILKYVPDTFNNYLEPFIGGGAIYFNLNHHKNVISDLNEELVNAYLQVRDNVEDLIFILSTYKNEESFYYKLRELKVNSLSDVESAARLLYLNKTCFNGLFRVNKEGHFNVPFGKRNGEFYNEETLRAASSYLKNAEIVHGHYFTVLDRYAKKGDLIFLDPPYYPVGIFSDFKRYTKEQFSDLDQVILADYFTELVNKGCKVILTNSNHPFITDLYSNFQMEVVKSKRMISRNPNTRDGEDLIVFGGI